MIKNIFIIHSVFEIDNFIIQSFFIYPRFYFQIGSKLFFFVNKLLNTKYIGDGLQKLKFKEEKELKFRNGILKILLFEKRKNFKIKEIEEKLKINFIIKEDYNCGTCKFNNNNFCDVWANKILKTKNKCDFWEEK